MCCSDTACFLEFGAPTYRTSNPTFLSNPFTIVLSQLGLGPDMGKFPIFQRDQMLVSISFLYMFIPLRRYNLHVVFVLRL